MNEEDANNMLRNLSESFIKRINYDKMMRLKWGKYGQIIERKGKVVYVHFKE